MSDEPITAENIRERATEAAHKLAKGGAETAMGGVTVACVCGHEFEAPTDLALGEHVHCPNCGSYFDVCHACRGLGPDGSLLFRINKKQVAVLKKYLAQWRPAKHAPVYRRLRCPQCHRLFALDDSSSDSGRLLVIDAKPGDRCPAILTVAQTRCTGKLDEG